jgi:hypothetical protein
MNLRILPRAGTLLAATLLLAACSGSGGSSSTASCDEQIWTGEFGLCLPEGWEEVSDELLMQKQVPEETIAAFRLTEKRARQRDIVVVSKETLSEQTDSMGYAGDNIKTVAVTPDYKLIDKREKSVDGKETLLHIFSAKPVPDVPARRFYQLSIVKGNLGYTFTASLPFSVPNEINEEIVALFDSVTLEEAED